MKYNMALNLQESLVKQLQAGEDSNFLVTVEHDPGETIYGHFGGFLIFKNFNWKNSVGMTLFCLVHPSRKVRFPFHWPKLP